MKKTSATRAMACALMIAAAAAGPARADGQGACAVLDSPFTLAEIIEQALVSQPGTVVKAGFVVLRDGEGNPVTLFQVKVRPEEGPPAAHLFYDVATGEPVEPPVPNFTLLEAYAIAVAAVEAATTTEGEATVLKGRIAHPLLAPTYVFAVVDPDSQLALAHVDALTGEVELFSPDQVSAKEPKRRLQRKLRRFGRHHRGFECDDMDADRAEGPAEEEVPEG